MSMISAFFATTAKAEADPGENIVTDGLIFRVDAGDENSYPGTGTTWTDVINGNNGSIDNGTAYNSAEGGYFDFDGVDDVSKSLSKLTSLPS